MPLTTGRPIHLIGSPTELQDTDGKVTLQVRWDVEYHADDGSVQFLTGTASTFTLDRDTFEFLGNTFAITRGTVSLEAVEGKVFGIHFGEGEPRLSGSIEWPGGKRGSFGVSPTGRSCGMLVELE